MLQLGWVERVAEAAARADATHERGRFNVHKPREPVRHYRAAPSEGSLIRGLRAVADAFVLRGINGRPAVDPMRRAASTPLLQEG